jgi:alpha-tubulin suppressor-like RCC1 family protein
VVKVAFRMRTLGRAGVVLVALEGCAAVAGLGSPVQISTSDTTQPQAQAIAVGGTHACATITEGQSSSDNWTIRCWGSNASGQLGSDPTVLAATSQPQPVTDFSGMTSEQSSALSLAPGYSCAISSGGYLYCWGSVPAEDLSGVHRYNPATAYAPSPMYLLDKELLPVTSASLDTSGGCILEGLTSPQGQSLVCWGTLAPYAGRDAGADGGGAAVTEPGFQAVAAGSANACAVAANDGASADVECWGDDTYGQSGGTVGGSIPDPSPIGLSDAQQVAAGLYFACALKSDGTVWCWGDNDHGELGPDGPAGSSAMPVQIPFTGGLTASSIALGDSHACAVMTDATETVECWGDNSYGQLGLGSAGPAQSATPGRVQRPTDGGGEDLPHVAQVAAGGGTTCVVRSNDPLVSCWGFNESGQAGQPAGSPVLYATAVQW